MSSFNNTANATSRIHALEKERKKRLDDVERRGENITTASVSAISTATAVVNFAAPSDSVNNDLLGSDTVGLITHDDFKARRQNLDRSVARERERRENRAATLAHNRNLQTLEKRKRANKAVLSFQNESDNEEDDDSDDDDDDDGGDDNDKESEKTISKRPRLGKDPTVSTKFLPDRDRERAERTERDRLRVDWLRQQEEIKSEMIRITYSYWDGSGHRRVMSCKKGITIGRFLGMVQMQFKQLRNTSADALMYIKEDLIIPHHYSFYDFVVMKARGKSGPLFNFDVVEDVRLVDDASREKGDAHASKVVERRWYERNRHIFPASRWEVYDPEKKYDRYTIHGK